MFRNSPFFGYCRCGWRREVISAPVFNSVLDSGFRCKSCVSTTGAFQSLSSIWRHFPFEHSFNHICVITLVLSLKRTEASTYVSIHSPPSGCSLPSFLPLAPLSRTCFVPFFVFFGLRCLFLSSFFSSEILASGRFVSAIIDLLEARDWIFLW